jgi:hypothetical protein
MPRLALTVFAILVAAAPAAAHPVPFSFVDLRVGGGAVDVTVVAHAYDLSNDLGLDVNVPERLLSPAVLGAHAAAIGSLIRARLTIEADGRDLSGGVWGRVEPLADRLSVRVTEGFASICWTNTESCMPAWGAADCRVGNNPLVIAVPRSEGPLVLDMAMSQYSYGKLQSTRLQGQSLAYDGGYDSEGRLTRDPGAIEASRRILPTGYWKGSGLTIMLDAMAALLSQGLATNQIDEIKQGSGTGASQVFMLFDPRQLGGAALAEQVANSVADYVQASEPAEADSRVMYPGASTWQRRADNLQRGVPVDEDIWHQVQALAQA